MALLWREGCLALRASGTAKVKIRRGEEIQNVLEEELERLKRILKTRYELNVVYAPDPSSKLDGEVKNGKIFIYAEGMEEVIKILKHEFIDHCVTKENINPLVHYINLQKTLIEYLIYRRKEEFVDALCGLL